MPPVSPSDISGCKWAAPQGTKWHWIVADEDGQKTRDTRCTKLHAHFYRNHIVLYPQLKCTFPPCFKGGRLNVLGFAWVWAFTKNTISIQQVKLPSLGQQECHFKAYWMKVSFARGCQRWRCYGNSFYCYQSLTVWQVNHLFIRVMILSCLDIYSCGMAAEEQKILSVSVMIGWPRFKGTILSIDFRSQHVHNALNLLLLHTAFIVSSSVGLSPPAISPKFKQHQPYQCLLLHHVIYVHREQRPRGLLL